MDGLRLVGLRLGEESRKVFFQETVPEEEEEIVPEEAFEQSEPSTFVERNVRVNPHTMLCR